MTRPPDLPAAPSMPALPPLWVELGITEEEWRDNDRWQRIVGRACARLAETHQRDLDARRGVLARPDSHAAFAARLAPVPPPDHARPTPPEVTRP